MQHKNSCMNPNPANLGVGEEKQKHMHRGGCIKFKEE